MSAWGVLKLSLKSYINPNYPKEYKNTENIRKLSNVKNVSIVLNKVIPTVFNNVDQYCQR